MPGMHQYKWLVFWSFRMTYKQTYRTVKRIIELQFSVPLTRKKPICFLYTQVLRDSISYFLLNSLPMKNALEILAKLTENKILLLK